MALSRPATEPLLLRDNRQGPFGPYEEIQYLRQQQTRAPTMPVAALKVMGPIAAVEDLITLSPNAEYFGKRELANGQVVHRSLATNVLRVFPADDSGIPYTLACHEFTVHLAAPMSPNEAWCLECPYPTNERLQAVVAGMVPRGVDLGFDLAFPSHATSIAPDMLPMMERLRLNQASRTTTNDVDTVVETLYGHHITAIPPQSTITQLPAGRGVVATGRRTSGYGIDMQGRPLDELEDSLFGSDHGSMPELVSEEEPIDLGICPFCLETSHASNYSCLLYVPRLSENEAIAVQALSSLATQELPEKRCALDETEMSLELHQVLDKAVGPMLTEWVAPVALRPQETTAEIQKMLESFVADYAPMDPKYPF
ncbi:hypothetical protein K438DRAFT_1967642 [Mycena galopus ATCC 62051]|nr:hypothetical protein K438DRAFT_1967642 [Mycena galopus ATCC 62051]